MGSVLPSVLHMPLIKLHADFCFFFLLKKMSTVTTVYGTKAAVIVRNDEIARDVRKKQIALISGCLPFKLGLNLVWMDTICLVCLDS